VVCGALGWWGLVWLVESDGGLGKWVGREVLMCAHVAHMYGRQEARRAWGSPPHYMTYDIHVCVHVHVHV
jgi:hypothetical protein